MSSRSLISLENFVARLRSFEAGVITRDSVMDYCESVQISGDSLSPYVLFDQSFYTRNLIYRDDLFEIMSICWQPHQKTAVHTHNGQLCWMMTHQGDISVVDYKWLGCDHPEHQNVVGLDCTAGSDHIKLEQVGIQECTGGGPVVTADKLQTIHQLFNGDAPTVTIHIYSRPIDSCVAFDMEKQSCYRRQLGYFSKYGQREFEGDRRSLPVIQSPH